MCTRKAFFKGQILRKLLPAKALLKACFSWYWRPKKVLSTEDKIQRRNKRRISLKKSLKIFYRSPWKLQIFDQILQCFTKEITMDTKNSVFLAFLTLSAISFSSIFAAQNTNSQIQAPSPTPFPVCIDDSDCVKLGKGDKFACFQVRNLTVFSFNKYWLFWLFLWWFGQ